MRANRRKREVFTEDRKVKPPLGESAFGEEGEMYRDW